MIDLDLAQSVRELLTMLVGLVELKDQAGAFGGQFVTFASEPIAFRLKQCMGTWRLGRRGLEIMECVLDMPEAGSPGEPGEQFERVELAWTGE